MVFVVPLCAFCTNGCLVSLAEHLQGLVVVSAEVTSGKGGRTRQPVLRHHRIPEVRRQVRFTIRRLTDEARVDRWQFVFPADVTEHVIRFISGLF